MILNIPSNLDYSMILWRLQAKALATLLKLLFPQMDYLYLR